MTQPRPTNSPSAIPPVADENSPAPAAHANEILTDRWPVLFRAMQDYKRQVADDFSALAYRCIREGIIRLDDRRRLAKAAARAGMRPFDAQILLACAIRQWTLDQGPERLAGRRRPSAAAPIARRWPTWTALLTVAIAADALVAWLWLS